jgi:subtilisin family serine protease
MQISPKKIIHNFIAALMVIIFQSTVFGDTLNEESKTKLINNYEKITRITLDLKDALRYAIKDSVILSAHELFLLLTADKQSFLSPFMESIRGGIRTDATSTDPVLQKLITFFKEVGASSFSSQNQGGNWQFVVHFDSSELGTKITSIDEIINENEWLKTIVSIAANYYLVPYDDDKDAFVAKKKIGNKIYKVFRYQHSLAAATRKALLISDIISLLKNKNPNSSLLIQINQLNKNIKNFKPLLHLASVLMRSGCKSKKSNVSTKKYCDGGSESFINEAANFSNYFDKKDVAYFANIMNLLGSTKTEKISAEQSTILTLLNVAHLLDLLRFPKIANVPNDIDNIVSKIADLLNIEKTDPVVLDLLNFSSRYLDATGDKNILQNRAQLLNQFYTLQTSKTNAALLVDAIETAPHTKAITAIPIKKEAVVLEPIPPQIERPIIRNISPWHKNLHWHLFDEKGINIEEAWNITNGSPNITIAVVDGGFVKDHPVFTTGNCEASYEAFDFFRQPFPINHGLNTSSVISSCPNNNTNLVSINSRSKMLLLEWGEGNSENYEDLFIWAMGDKNICNTPRRGMQCNTINLNKPDVINASFGSYIDNMILRRIILRLIKWVNSQGTIIVASAGNDSHSADEHFPAAATGVISAGATTKQGITWGSSNWGETIEILAPGFAIPTANINGLALGNGTSYAAPIVSGVVSLMRAVNANLNWKTAIYILQSTATPLTCNEYCSEEYSQPARAKCQTDCCVGNKQVCTPGRINAGAAVKMAKELASKIPNIALVDADNYYIDMLNNHGELTVYNTGGSSGKYYISSKDPAITFDKTEIVLSAKGQPGDKATIQVFSQGNFAKEVAIRIASPDSGVLNTFTDEIVIYAQPHLNLPSPRFTTAP